MAETFLSGAEFDLPPYSGKPGTSYLICSTPRSGSTLLCALLAQTGVMGVPHEYFHLPNHGQYLIKRLKETSSERLTINEYFDAIVKHRTSPNGVFGMKAHLNQCLPHYRSGFIGNYFGPVKHILIQRRDRLGQAISLAIATQTGKWTSHESAGKHAVFSREAIEKALDVCLYQDFMWQQFLATNRLEHCAVIYEDILQEPSREVQKIFDFVGIGDQADVSLAAAGLEKEAGSLNQQWREQFEATLTIPAAR